MSSKDLQRVAISVGKSREESQRVSKSREESRRVVKSCKESERVYLKDSDIIDKDDLPEELPDRKVLDICLRGLKTNDDLIACWGDYQLTCDSGGLITTFTLANAKI